jgi:uncharacterized damage-inducible protein DinB
MSDQKQLFIKMAVSAWETEVTRISKIVDSLSDQDLMKETAPGRNSGHYLLGHLIAVSDSMIGLLGWGERTLKSLDAPFLANPEKKAGPEKPGAAQLREYWKSVNSSIAQHIQKTSADDWFKRHNSVSDEDFAKEPHRNKLNLLMNRTNHMSYHRGQLIYLTKKADE